MSLIEEFSTKVERVFRREVTIPAERRKEFEKELDDGGWRVARQGAYTDSDMWPQCDPKRMQYVIERPMS